MSPIHSLLLLCYRVTIVVIFTDRGLHGFILRIEHGVDGVTIDIALGSSFLFFLLLFWFGNTRLHIVGFKEVSGYKEVLLSFCIGLRLWREMVNLLFGLLCRESLLFTTIFCLPPSIYNLEIEGRHGGFGSSTALIRCPQDKPALCVDLQYVVNSSPHTRSRSNPGRACTRSDPIGGSGPWLIVIVDWVAHPWVLLNQFIILDIVFVDLVLIGLYLLVWDTIGKHFDERILL